MALRIVVAGEIYLDQVFAGFAAWPEPGEEAFAKSLTREAGGGAAITAAGLARLGWDVSLIGPVGNDPAGTDLRSRIERLGLRTNTLYEHASEPTGTTVAISMPEDRTFFTYRGANADLEAALRGVPEADHLHIAAPCDAALLGWLCKRAKTVSVDVGLQLEWLRDETMQDALRSAAWFFPNEKEAAVVTGEAEPEAMLERFDALGIRAAVKLGTCGSATVIDGRYVQVASIQVQPIDTTGAGDCFNAGFLDAWLREEPLALCLQSGNICGALSTREMGGMNGFPTREELSEWRSKSL
ncbi:MAG TPA: carbohydrate kinase family protein [Bryobacteraceae bacterium]|nr:carbohydrate kinase family protein [Bryobacteraceae bacterium]